MVIISRPIYVAENGIVSFSVIAEQYSITHTHTHTHTHTRTAHLYLSVNGHLGCFHVLAVVTGVSVNIGVCSSFQIRVYSGYMFSSGIEGFYDSSIFSFLKNLHTVLIVAVPICIHTNCVGEFLFLHILSSIYYL